MQILERVAEMNTAEAYKVNFNCGFVLVNKETGEYRYFAPGTNNTFFKKPKRVDRPSVWRSIAEEITPESDGLCDAAQRRHQVAAHHAH